MKNIAFTYVVLSYMYSPFYNVVVSSTSKYQYISIMLVFFCLLKLFLIDQPMGIMSMYY